MPAAIMTGPVAMPITIWGCLFIEQQTQSQLLLMLWSVVAFMIPFLVSTVDLRYLAARRRELGLFGSFIPPVSRDAFRQLYVPGWLRIAAWFVSAVVSVTALKTAGVRL